MVTIKWAAPPADIAFARAVERIVRKTLGYGAMGEVTLVCEGDDVVRVPPTRLVPDPRVWDTFDIPVRVDSGIIAELRSAGVKAR